MGNITLSLPDETKKKMKKFPEIKWSEVVRQAINKKIDELEQIEKQSNYSGQEIKQFFSEAAEDVDEYINAQKEVVLKDE